jgi:hypothetical protein
MRVFNFGVFNSGSGQTVRRSAESTAFFVLLAASSLAAQLASVSAYQDPVELVRKATQNEIKADSDDGSHFQFVGTKTTPKGSTTRRYIENKEATAGMVIAYDGQPLTAEQRRAEDARIERLVSHPEEVKQKHDQERENAEHTMRIMRALPDAFVFEYAGQEPASAGVGRIGTQLVKLNFKPNSRYQPPSHVEEVLTGMQGFVLIDPIRLRLASIDGTLFKEVGFGWGILGHLNSGGRFVVQQQDVGDDHWEISNMTLNFAGKILLFKNLSINSTEVFSEFRPVPADLTFTQALDMLKKQETSEAAEKSCCQQPRATTE